MIIDKMGKSLFYGNKSFKVGSEVFANEESDYAGLFGKIKEIRTDGDKETENPGPDIYCDFNEPEEQTDRESSSESVIRTETANWVENFEDVIMAPEMLEVLPQDIPEPDSRVFSLSYVSDDFDTGMISGAMGVSPCIGVLLRRMLKDVQSYELKLVLTHVEERGGGYLFVYEPKDINVPFYVRYDITNAAWYEAAA